MKPTDDFTKNQVFTESYWKRPVSEDRGYSDPHKIYEAVGFALTSWELAEEALADLYLNLVDASKSSGNPVRRAFGSIESNSGRRNAINAAAEAFFRQDWEDKTIKRAFLLVTDAVGWAARRRDDTAHGNCNGPNTRWRFISALSCFRQITTRSGLTFMSRLEAAIRFPTR